MRVRPIFLTAVLLIAVLAFGQQPSRQPMASPAQPQQQQPTSMPQHSGQMPTSMGTAGQEPLIKPMQQSAFRTTPGQPECFMSVIERGNPKTGPYVAFVKLDSGCTIPLHWHSANEDLMFTSGTGQFQAKGEQPQTVSQGAYVYMPARHQHQLSCGGGCTFYVTRDGAADIHYVDPSGNELSPESALAAVGERPARQ